MANGLKWVPPDNFVSEVSIRIKGTPRYRVTCFCTGCGTHYLNSRAGMVKRKSTLCKACIDSEPTPESIKQKISAGLKRRYKNSLNRQITSRAMKGVMAGSKHWNWKGGITSINQQARNSVEYKIWRNQIFSRDNYTCRLCNKRGNTIHAHHIIEWASNFENRFILENGVTLCKKCHSLVHKYEDIKLELERLIYGTNVAKLQEQRQTPSK